MSETANLAVARSAALAAIAARAPESSDAIEYSSAGTVVVAGDATNPARALQAAQALGETPVTILLHDESSTTPIPETRDGVATVVCRLSSVDGHLGAFNFRLRDGDGESVRKADVVLDLRTPPLFARRVLPPGCFEPARFGGDDDATRIQAAADAAREMRGVFRKPKYFRYRESLCAHEGSGVRGCERCVSACPAEAITSVGRKIEVNPNLCQGCGACVMTCPAGALRYDYPSAAGMLAALRESFSVYRERSGGASPLALFHSGNDAKTVAALSESGTDSGTDSALLPLELEEVGAAGIEVWLCALAYGACGVGVYAEGNELRGLANAQAEVANDILSAMNFPRAIRIVSDSESAMQFIADFSGAKMLTKEPAKFAPDDDKRAMFFSALDFLLENAGGAPDVVSLKAQSPFGEVVVDADKCTLCMACAGACPSSAIRAGGDSPRLLFVEENCVQCGLCESACPEDAAALRPRMLFSREARRAARVLNEDPPFCCVACGKPFATARIIARVEEKLRGHWMYQDDAARRRLRLCEDCRAADMFGGELVRRSDGDEKGGS